MIPCVGGYVLTCKIKILKALFVEICNKHQLPQHGDMCIMQSDVHMSVMSFDEVTM